MAEKIEVQINGESQGFDAAATRAAQQAARLETALNNVASSQSRAASAAAQAAGSTDQLADAQKAPLMLPPRPPGKTTKQKIRWMESGQRRPSLQQLSLQLRQPWDWEPLKLQEKWNSLRSRLQQCWAMPSRRRLC